MAKKHHNTLGFFGQILFLLPHPHPFIRLLRRLLVFSLFQPSISRQERSKTSSLYYFENYHILWRKVLDSTISIQQKPLTRSLQLPHIFLSRRFHRPIYFQFEFISNSDPLRKLTTVTNCNQKHELMLTCRQVHVRPHCFILYRSVPMKTKTGLFRDKNIQK